MKIGFVHTDARPFICDHCGALVVLLEKHRAFHDQLEAVAKDVSTPDAALPNIVDIDEGANDHAA